MNSTSPGPTGSVEVDDDDVEAVLAGGGEVLAVGNHQFKARIVEAALVDGRQVLPGEVDHAGVDLDHDEALDPFMLEHFLGHAAITAADDEHAFNLAVRQDGHVRQHLVIAELVALGDLRHAVEPDHVAERDRAAHDQSLVRRVRIEQRLLDPVRGAIAGVEAFIHPHRAVVFGLQAHRLEPRSSSLTRTSPALKRRRRTSTHFSGWASPHMNTSSAA